MQFRLEKSFREISLVSHNACIMENGTVSQCHSFVCRLWQALILLVKMSFVVRALGLECDNPLPLKTVHPPVMADCMDVSWFWYEMNGKLELYVAFDMYLVWLLRQQFKPSASWLAQTATVTVCVHKPHMCMLSLGGKKCISKCHWMT